MFPTDDATNRNMNEGPSFPVTVDAYRKALEPHSLVLQEGYLKLSNLGWEGNWLAGGRVSWISTCEVLDRLK